MPTGTQVPSAGVAKCLSRTWQQIHFEPDLMIYAKASQFFGSQCVGDKRSNRHGAGKGARKWGEWGTQKVLPQFATRSMKQNEKRKSKSKCAHILISITRKMRKWKREPNRERARERPVQISFRHHLWPPVSATNCNWRIDFGKPANNCALITEGSSMKRGCQKQLALCSPS